jgi:hypothetical protein
MVVPVGTYGPNTARADGPNVRGMSTSIERPGDAVSDGHTPTAFAHVRLSPDR